MVTTTEKLWHRPAVIAPNNFIYKSLSNWSYNIAVGCEHGCRWCYVPATSTNKMAAILATHGVDDPDEQWGEYVMVRPWDEHAFMNSLKRAEKTPLSELKPDGNRAVMMCSTTDPYQILHSLEMRRQLQRNMRLALRAILEHSTLRVRILTRSPLAESDFELMKEFGPRLLFGMSIPTLDNKLARIYEPKAPAPTQRLSTLRRAKEKGLNIYVAMAPTYPECYQEDLERTLAAFQELEPVTIFHEPINIRAENVERIRKHAESLGVKTNTEVFADSKTWANYALRQFDGVVNACLRMKITQLHLWPDKSLKRLVGDRWYMEHWWNKISDWPH